MSRTVIKIENLSKVYRLGEVGTGTISHDLNRFFAKIRGKEDPFAKVGSVNDRTQKAVKGEMVRALSDINLEIKEGEVLGIIGKNGAGKSTLLKILSRITSPTTGSYKIKGRMASLLEVGTGFNPELTGRENIYMNGTIMGMRKWEIDRKLDEIVDFSGVAKYLDTPTKRYSSGMTVRLGFAVAAHLDPEILVVDEVLAVGDAEFQKKAIGKMQEVSHGQGRTVLFVSHNMSSISQLCSTGVLLKNGTIDTFGEINSVINSYLTNPQTKQIYEAEDKPYDISISKLYLSGNDTLIRNSYRFDEQIVINSQIIAQNIPSNATMTLFVYNQREELIFTTHLSLFDLINLGVNNIVTKLPSKLLLPGSYSLSTKIHIPNIAFIDCDENAIYFDIEDTGHEHSMYNINLGLISVRLEWELKN